MAVDLLFGSIQRLQADPIFGGRERRLDLIRCQANEFCMLVGGYLIILFHNVLVFILLGDPRLEHIDLVSQLLQLALHDDALLIQKLARISSVVLLGQGGVRVLLVEFRGVALIVFIVVDLGGPSRGRNVPLVDFFEGQGVVEAVLRGVKADQVIIFLVAIDSIVVRCGHHFVSSDLVLEHSRCQNLLRRLILVLLLLLVQMGQVRILQIALFFGRDAGNALLVKGVADEVLRIDPVFM